MTATDAVITAARNAGMEITRAQASALAIAALTHADSQCTVTRVALRERWANEGYRAHIRAEMQRALHEGLIEDEMLPVTLSAEKLIYQDDRMAEMPEFAPWSQVQIVLRVPVRRSRGVSA